MSDLHNNHATSTSSTSTSTSNYAANKQALLSSNNTTTNNAPTTVGVVSGLSGNSRFDFVILSKLDKDGNLNLLHTKPLSVELVNQVPDSLIVFTEGEL